ncbi:hypothetical protein OF83DRAFT_233079 [Amylostereum chailletii]|nr:hypothetical protein OF83DRAFT_233079 [Amylostereum chailletii]
MLPREWARYMRLAVRKTLTFNSLQQNPCLVASTLRAVCAKSSFAVDPVPVTGVYAGPSGDDIGNICSCSTVTYSLMSACGACQGGSWGTWKDWSLNCTATLSDGVFPAEFIPSSTKVPHWAFQEVTVSGNWSLETAQGAGDTPENTSSTSSSPSCLPSSHPSSPPSSLSPSPSFSPSSSSPLPFLPSGFLHSFVPFLKRRHCRKHCWWRSGNRVDRCSDLVLRTPPA